MPDPGCTNAPPDAKDKAEMDESVLDQKRTCPYCSKVIETRPYWSHIATEHPAEYENSQGTWLPLYKDYATAGMEIATILMVMSELFNAKSEDIESFLMHSLYKEKVAAGTCDADAKAELAQLFGCAITDIEKRIKLGE
ncbi:MAG: hypothetical protein JW839_08475 [Candidatus Lokiarchaeota archaeon]|nr:hypothetical protein [Candidatus Lokiarchaeota archaeon]